LKKSYLHHERLGVLKEVGKERVEGGKDPKYGHVEDEAECYLNIRGFVPLKKHGD